MWTVYIIRAKSGKLYTGITTDLKRRLSEHKNGRRGARFFRFSKAQKILYREPRKTRSEATKREQAIKRMRKVDKLRLIRGD